jgi:DNA-binding MarR family transcriptional regulator
MEYVVEKIIKLEGASKTHTLAGEPYDEDNPQHFSEWAVAFALARFHIGDVIKEEVLHKLLSDAKTQQTVDSLVAKGLFEETWDPDKGEPAYALTEEGKEVAENILKSE